MNSLNIAKIPTLKILLIKTWRKRFSRAQFTSWNEICSVILHSWDRRINTSWCISSWQLIVLLMISRIVVVVVAMGCWGATARIETSPQRVPLRSIETLRLFGGVAHGWVCCLPHARWETGCFYTARDDRMLVGDGNVVETTVLVAAVTPVCASRCVVTRRLPRAVYLSTHW